MVILYAIGLILLELILFFYMYVASMAMLRAKEEGKFNNVLWALCATFVLVALVVDFLNNVFIFSFLFWSIPKEWLVTHRMKKHVNENTWRGAEARWFGFTLLNPFDIKNNHLGYREDKNA